MSTPSANGRMKTGVPPGVVQYGWDTSRAGCCRYCDDIGHFEGAGTGALEHDRGRCIVQEFRNVRADHRIEILDFNALLRQEPVAECPGVAVDVVSDQHMAAWPCQRHQCR